MCLKVSYLPIFFIYYSKADEIFFGVGKRLPSPWHFLNDIFY